VQNIDGLESMAGVPDDLLVECHGHFRTASCIRCKEAASIVMVKDSIVTRQEVPICIHCTKSGKALKKQRPAYVKPDIVFFGEGLPKRFHDMLPNDTESADLCMVLGTSLQVPPSAYIPDMVNCPRVLLNRELVGNFKILDDDDVDDNDRDLFECGNCDDSIISIAKVLGWDKELRQRHEEMIQRFQEKTNTSLS
jgi:NAD-dependent SIR2 family protein deacetylase